jgi:hypothetical protein
MAFLGPIPPLRTASAGFRKPIAEPALSGSGEVPYCPSKKFLEVLAFLLFLF